MQLHGLCTFRQTHSVCLRGRLFVKTPTHTPSACQQDSFTHVTWQYHLLDTDMFTFQVRIFPCLHAESYVCVDGKLNVPLAELKYLQYR